MKAFEDFSLLKMKEFALRAAHSLLIPGSLTYPWLGSMDGFQSGYAPRDGLPAFRFEPSEADAAYMAWMESKPSPVNDPEGCPGSYEPEELGEKDGFEKEP